MKICHVITYVSRDGSFGGPTAVALGQLSALAEQGHEVELVAGWDGNEFLRLPGVKISLFKVYRLWPGFTGLVSPSLYLYLLKNMRPDTVLHVHLGRDLITLLAAVVAQIKSVTYLVQTHGMVMPTNKTHVKIMDRLLTRCILWRASSVLVLTNDELRGVSEVRRRIDGIEKIPNGIAAANTEDVVRDSKSILFLARLHPRKRVITFVQMCRLLVDEGIEFTAHVIGPDEGDLARLRSAVTNLGLQDRVFYEGTIRPGSSIERLAKAGVYVLPSVGEVFPMTVLEALAAKTPVITTDQSGLADDLARLGAAVVTDGSPQELMAAVKKVMISPAERRLLIENGTKAIQTVFSINAVVGRLLELYSTGAKR